MPFVPVPQFSAAVQSLLSDGFETVRGLSLSKGRKAVRVIHNVDDGNVAAMATAARDTRYGTLEAAFTSEGMLCSSFVAQPERAPGLAVRVDSAVGAQGVLPLAGLELMYQHEKFTASASVSPAQGLVLTGTSGAEPLMVGGAVLLQPDGRRSTLVGVTLGGAISAIVTMPQDAGPLLHASAVMQPTPTMLVGAMWERAVGAASTTALGVAYQVEEHAVSVKAMVLQGAAELDGRSEPFAVAKAAVVKGFRNVQLGACVELPIKAPSGAPTAPKYGLTLGISLDPPPEPSPID
ncbi:hypothetical protein KFE25_007416 [Diacronema lutheri]|uniref:Uncharacterized protein n=2 Tax=Diacronema lutheri TaxID=2081491 RepID=A0A8J5XP67_DIALT|nr:hypothetical protein KFE25_007416 [Diacronema lutheri]